MRPSKEHAEAVREEVTKLKQAGAIKEVFLFKIVSKYRDSKEEECDVASLCRFHGFE